MIGPKAYINIKRLKDNLLNIRTVLGSNMIMVVVKANGYGHGALNIVDALKNEPDIIFCVFTVEEALEIRNSGVSNNIFIFSKIHLSWLEIADVNNFWINISCFEDLEMITDYHNVNNSSPKVHIKFDTGMTRLGFDIKDAKKIFKKISQNQNIPIEGIYSHLSTADEGDLSFAKDQLDKFNETLKVAEKYSLNFKYIHCSNSGAILNLPNSFFNTVRVGMLLYGVAPSDEVEMNPNLKPVMSFCGPIVHVRRVNANTPVSYGGVYKTSKETNIAVVQTGFADGFPRPWYERGYVSYKGNYYKIAGRVCMDQLMIDFGETNPTIGEEVLFFGQKGDDELPIERIVNDISTTSYVLLTGIHGRTERFNI